MDSEIKWQDFTIDADRLQISQQDGTLVMLRANKKLPGKTVEILLLLMERTGDWVFGSDIKDWKQLPVTTRNKNLTSHMSILRRALKLPKAVFAKDIHCRKRRPGSDDEVGYMFVGGIFSYVPVMSRHSNRLSPARPRLDEEKVRAIGESLGLEGSALLDQVLSLKKRPGRKQQLDALREAKQKIRRSNLNAQLLAEYYKDEQLSKQGLARYTASVENQALSTNIAVPRNGLNLTVDLERAPKHGNYEFIGTSQNVPSVNQLALAEFLADTWLTDTQADNDPVLCLESFSMIDPTAMSFSLARYFDFRLSWGKLDNEIARALMSTDYDIGRVIDNKGELLSDREFLLRDSRSIIDCNHRLCVGGVNVVFALRRVNYEDGKDDFMVYIAERSNAVAFAQGEQSVIPSGFHTVFVETPYQAWISPWQSVYRELGEELFGRDEAISQEGKIEFDPRGADCEPVHWFKGRENKVLHEIVAFGFDMIDGSYQLSILLVVEDPCYWDRYGLARLNYEYKYPGRKAITISTRDRDGLRAILCNPLCAHTSLFALVPALQRLKKIEPTRVDLPAIETTTAW